jgi:hypothetical protein
MHSLVVRSLVVRPGRPAIALLVLATALAACAPSAPSDTPAGVVQQAIDLAANKDLEGLQGLACAGQEAMISDQLGMTGALDVSALLPGLDMQALLDAVRVDVQELEPGEAVIDGDSAEVPVAGTVKVTFDKEAMRPILATLLEQSGTTMTDDQLGALLDSLEAYGSDLPVDEVISLVREDGAWKICQESLGPSSGG